MNTYAEYIHFFRCCVEAHPHLCSFEQGDGDRILNRERSTLEYPLLWLESPDIDFDSKNTALVFSGSFVILNDASFDDWKRQDYHLDYTFQLALDIIKKLCEAAESCAFEVLSNRIKMEALPMQTHDADFGWRVSFAIQSSVCDCLCITPKCPIGGLASFEWKNETKGDFTAFQISKILHAPEDHPWQPEWSWSFDNGTVQTSTDEIPTISGSGRWLYITLKLTDENGCEQCASALVGCDAACGHSIPYLYNPNRK